MKSIILSNYDKTYQVEYVTDYSIGKENFFVSEVKGESFIEGHSIPTLTRSEYKWSWLKQFALSNKLNINVVDQDNNDSVSTNAEQLTITTEGLSGGVNGVNQVSTLTIVGVVTLAGKAKLTFTSGLLEEPYNLLFDVDLGDDETLIASKAVLAIKSNKTLSNIFDSEIAEADLIISVKSQLTNDETLNISIDNDTCEGLTNVIQSVSTTQGVANEDYSETLESEGGNGVYEWSIIDGELPDGLQLSKGGAISGNPTTSGEFTFIVKCYDWFTNNTKELNITITSNS